jgi:CRP/FNR family transcriptional regulator
MSPLHNKELVEQQIRQIAGDDVQLVDELIQNSTHVRLNKGQFAFRTGEQCSAYLVVLKGHVRVQLISAGGREVTLYRVDPGHTCVLTTSCLLSGNEYPAEAIAESEVEALGISQAAFQDALAKYANFRQHVFEKFSERLKNVIVRVEELVFESVDARLARTLLKLDSEGKQDVTHQELAVELGTAREVISRHLKQFKDDGLVRLGRGRVVVTDADRLKGIGASGLM